MGQYREQSDQSVKNPQRDGEQSACDGRAGAEWDGATFALDFEGVLMASCVHDILLKDRGGPFSRYEVDVIFYDVMRSVGFRFSWLYYIMVRMFSVFVRFNRFK